MKPNDRTGNADGTLASSGELTPLADLVAAFPMAALIVTTDGEFRVANEALYALLGRDGLAAGAQPADDAHTALGVISPDLDVLVHRARAGPLPVGDHVVHVRTGQRLDVTISRCGASMLLLTFRDTSERNTRLAAMGRMASEMVHDINNVLSPILGASYLLQHHADSPDMVRDYAERIRKSAESGAAGLSRIGRFIRQVPPLGDAGERIDLTRVMDDLLTLMEPLLAQRSEGSSRIYIMRHLAPEAAMSGVMEEIRGALRHVITNAIDAMAETGGRLTVTTEVLASDVVVSVADTGVGMPDHVRDHAFEPFFTTKGPGTSGLGLSEVFGVVSRHGGAIHIESAEGHGATVTLRFPAAPDAPAAEEALTRADTPTPLKILLVEDNADGRELLVRALKRHHYEVDAVASCAEAHERLALASFLQYHLLLTDIGLPDGNGWDLAAAAKSRSPGIRVGVLTGWEPTVRETDRTPVEFVLQKPLRIATLMSHIAGQSRPAQPE